jgi:hypothetical protein
MCDVISLKGCERVAEDRDEGRNWVCAHRLAAPDALFGFKTPV